MGLCSHFRGGGLTGTDGPYGFISNDQRRCFQTRDTAECDIALSREHFLSQSGLAFFEYLSHADNRLEFRRQGSLQLAVDRRVGFTKILTPLGMTDNDVGAR